MRNFLASFRLIRVYALLLLLPLGWFAWGLLTNRRLLGDDNESTETLGASSSGSHRSGGHGGYARFYHK